MRSIMTLFGRRFGKKDTKKYGSEHTDDSGLSDFNMFMDAGEERQDTDLNELSEHLKFVNGGASTLKRRL